MVVQTQERHPGHRGAMGLHIGALNVQEHFPRGTKMVELELDHLCIVCPLEPSFWQDAPEIHDPRLSLWLEAKRTSGKLGPQAAPVAMIPKGKSCFRLQVMSKEEVDRALIPTAAELSETVFLPSAVLPSAVPAAALMERRNYDAGRAPERRRTRRPKLLNLGGDERSSLAASH
jgi:hypothetical protein